MSQQKNLDYSITFATPFSNKYQQITQIIQKLLPILPQDPVLDSFLQTGVKYVAKKARTIGNIVSPSAFTNSPHDTWLEHNGCYNNKKL